MQMGSKSKEANLSVLQVLVNVYVAISLFLKLILGLQEVFGLIL